MSDAQYNQYKNLFEFAAQWRGLKVVKHETDRKKFNKNMQFDEYTLSTFKHPDTGRVTYIYLFMEESRYAASGQDMLKLLVGYTSACDIILITENTLSSHLNKALAKLKRKNTLVDIYCYRHEIFSLICPYAPLTCRHRIMKRDEVEDLLKRDLHTTVANLPRIYDNDPQCVWIGARVGHVLELTAPSYITHKCITYKLVVPVSGTVRIAKADVPILEVEEDATAAADDTETADEVIANETFEAEDIVDDGAADDDGAGFD